TGNYSYSIVNEDANINYSNSGNFSGDNTIFSYDFNQPGKYVITVKYSLNQDNVNANTKDISVTCINKTVTYYVYYNKLTISATSLNPDLGTTDTLSVNNSKVYYSTTGATYQ
ncbi:hypothetical protein IKS57_05545, partial [bacterium]|nr:hypothetical protein [bacterium]